MEPSDVDQALGCGLYQILHSVVYQLAVIVLSSNMSIMAFLKRVPKLWKCDGNISLENANSTFIQGHLFETESLCQGRQSGSLASCPKWVPAEQLDFYSIVPEWDLICGRTPLIFWSITIQMAGIFFGSPIGGQISDWFGRKWTLLISVSALMIFGNASAFSTNIWAFLIFRFFIGFACGLVSVINAVYLTEFLLPKHRLWVTSVGSFPLGQGLLTLFAWLSADWRKLTWIINTVPLPCVLLLYFMKESPRWAIHKHDFEGARKSLSFVVKMNGRKAESVPRVNAALDTLLASDETTKNKKKQYNIRHLFSTPKLSIYTTVVSASNFAVSMISYVFMFDSDNLAGNHFVNFFIMTSLLRFLATLAAVLADYFVKPFGRRILITVPLALICLSCVCICFVEYFHANNIKLIITICSFFAMCLTSPIWITLMISITELFPTPIRNVAMGSTQMMTRVASMLAPQLLYLSTVWEPGPYVTCAIASFVSCVAWAIFIPETKGHELPDQMPMKRRKLNS